HEPVGVEVVQLREVQRQDGVVRQRQGQRDAEFGEDGVEGIAGDRQRPAAPPGAAAEVAEGEGAGRGLGGGAGGPRPPLWGQRGGAAGSSLVRRWIWPKENDGDRAGLGVRGTVTVGASSPPRRRPASLWRHPAASGRGSASAGRSR